MLILMCYIMRLSVMLSITSSGYDFVVKWNEELTGKLLLLIRCLLLYEWHGLWNNTCIAHLLCATILLSILSSVPLGVSTPMLHGGGHTYNIVAKVFYTYCARHGQNHFPWICSLNLRVAKKVSILCRRSSLVAAVWIPTTLHLSGRDRQPASCHNIVRLLYGSNIL